MQQNKTCLKSTIDSTHLQACWTGTSTAVKQKRRILVQRHANGWRIDILMSSSQVLRGWSSCHECHKDWTLLCHCLNQELMFSQSVEEIFFLIWTLTGNSWHQACVDRTPPRCHKIHLLHAKSRLSVDTKINQHPKKHKVTRPWAAECAKWGNNCIDRYDSAEKKQKAMNWATNVVDHFCKHWFEMCDPQTQINACITFNVWAFHASLCNTLWHKESNWLKSPLEETSSHTLFWMSCIVCCGNWTVNDQFGPHAEEK